MGHLVERMRAIGPTRAALLLAAAILIAAIAYVGLRDAEVGRRAEAGAAAAQQQPPAPPQDSGEEEKEEAPAAEPLTLTLHAPDICETLDPGDGADGAWSHGLEWNEAEGVWEDESADSWWYWDSVGTIEVAWTAAGGDGAYTVTIGGETYEGASGAAWLRCASDGELVAGWGEMTVAAAVTDGSGASAEASASVEVLSAGDGGGLLLIAGETFLIKGWLITIPHEFNMMLGDYEETICPPADDDGEPVCELAFGLAVQTERYYAWLSIGEQSGAEGGRQIWLTDEDDPEAMALRDEVHLAFDRLIVSLARPAPQEGE